MSLYHLGRNRGSVWSRMSGWQKFGFFLFILSAVAFGYLSFEITQGSEAHAIGLVVSMTVAITSGFLSGTFQSSLKWIKEGLT